MSTKSPATSSNPPRTVMPSGYKVDQTTELGSFVLKHKSAALSIIILILAGIGAFGGYRYISAQKTEEWNQKLYQYNVEVFQAFEAGKLEKPALLEGVKKLQADLVGYEGAVAPLMLTADELVKRGDTTDAKEILSWIRNNYSAAKIRFFAGIRLASLLEDMGETEPAVEVLNELAQGQFKVFEGKIHLDLGRLYLKLENSEKAKTHFQYVLEKSDENEFKKMAQLYLEQLGQK